MQKNHEWISIPVLLLVNFFVMLFAKDHNFVVYDISIYQKLFLATLFFALMLMIVRLAMRLYFPTLMQHIDEDRLENSIWEGFTKPQKVAFAVALYCSLIVAFSIVMTAI